MNWRCLRRQLQIHGDGVVTQHHHLHLRLRSQLSQHRGVRLASDALELQLQQLARVGLMIHHQPAPASARQMIGNLAAQRVAPVLVEVLPAGPGVATSGIETANAAHHSRQAGTLGPVMWVARVQLGAPARRMLMTQGMLKALQTMHMPHMAQALCHRWVERRNGTPYPSTQMIPVAGWRLMQ